MNFQIQKEDLEQCAILFDTIRERFKQFQNIDEKLAYEFEFHIKQVFLENELFHCEDPFKINGLNLNAQSDIYKISEQKFEDLLNQFDAQLADIYVQIMKKYRDIQSKAENLWEQQYQQDVSELKLQINQLQKNNKTNQQTIIELEEQLGFQSQGLNLQPKIDQLEINMQKSKLENQQLKKEMEKYKQIIEDQKQEAKNNLQLISQLSQQNQKQRDPVLNVRQNQKTMSLIELKSLIQEIYKSKQESDQTMEKYLYQFLVLKYKTKQLAIDQANSITQAIQDYHLSDSQVLLFHKLIKHQLPESFRLKLQSIHSQIQKIISQKQQNLQKHDISYAIRNIFSKQESEEIINQISDKYIDYDNFIDLVDKFMIENEDGKIYRFNQIFKQIDLDDDGILDQQQFKQLISNLRIQDKVIYQNLLDFATDENQLLYSKILDYLQSQKDPQGKHLLYLLH